MVFSPPCGAQDAVTSTLDRFAYGQVAKSPVPGESGAVDSDSGFHVYRITQEKNRLWALIMLAITALVAHSLLLWRLGNSSPSRVVTGTGFIYLVFGTIVLVLLADNKDQLTASMGIIGAIAGYLFGAARPALARGRGSRATHSQNELEKK